MASEIESEAVRMPIDLPPLDFKPKPLQQESNWQLRSECRERQLLAALTELQTERAAHERTRGEQQEMKEKLERVSARLSKHSGSAWVDDLLEEIG